jgi:hypothetical protein
MKKAIVTTLLASGLLLAAKGDNKMTNEPKLSGNQKVALATQSPRVRTGTHHKKHAQDRVVSDKKTINAYVQPGK